MPTRETRSLAPRRDSVRGGARLRPGGERQQTPAPGSERPPRAGNPGLHAVLKPRRDTLLCEYFCSLWQVFVTVGMRPFGTVQVRELLSFFVRANTVVGNFWRGQQ